MGGKKHVSIGERFWEKVAVGKPDECWPWLASTSRYGYGRFRIGPASKGHIHAHRMAYQLIHGEIPENLPLDHVCHTLDLSCPGGNTDCPHRSCVNPNHLEPVTNAENLLRGRGIGAVNAAKTHCIHGHPFSEENTYVWRTERKCRTCRQVHQTNWLNRNRDVA